MTSPYPFREAEPKQERLQIAETNVGIRCAVEDLQKGGVTHSPIMLEVMRECVELGNLRWDSEVRRTYKPPD